MKAAEIQFSFSVAICGTWIQSDIIFSSSFYQKEIQNLSFKISPVK